MLTYLPPLFFFAALMGSPVVGFLVFMVMGIVVMGTRKRAGHHTSQWQRTDTLVALCFMSIPLFKALSVLWSATPRLAWENAFQHSYFLFWPLVLLGLHRCRSHQFTVDRAIATGLLAYALYALSLGLKGAAITDVDGTHQNPGIAAQIAMVLGTWNLLALTRPGSATPTWRSAQALALGASFVILMLTTRRLELLGFSGISTLIVCYRLRRQLSWGRSVLALIALTAVLGLLLYLRWDKFALGFEQIAQYKTHGANTPDFTTNSWGIRLELWRVGWAAFMDHPWLGLSASARPYTMQPWGAPPAELFGHNHFHSHLIQTLVEGGLLGLCVLVITLSYSTWQMVIKPFRSKTEVSLLGAGVLLAYIAEGLGSATLHYDKPNALLVVTSCWVWLQLRSSELAQNPLNA